jgi:hypothetical protein
MIAHPTAKELTERLGGRWHDSIHRGRGQCPAHDDASSSLDIIDKDGKTLFICRAGCTQESVLGALRDLGLWHQPDGKANRKHQARKIVETYDYELDTGELHFQVVRYAPKDFRQRRPDGNGGWIWNAPPTRHHIPYRLPEVLEAIANETTVFIVEGEKDVDNVAKLGVVATCNACGAGNWHQEHAAHLKGADVVIVPDNDTPGQQHGEDVAASLQGIAKRVRKLILPDLPPKGDLSDWIVAGGTPEQLWALVEQAPDWPPACYAEIPGLVSSSIEKQTNRHDIEAEAEWPDPILLPTGLLPVAPFDYEMLPEKVRHWVEDVSERMQCPPDYVAVTVVAALGSLIGRKVSIRPKLEDDWAVVSNVWGLLIGPPGIMKSPAQSDGLRPIKMLAATAREAFKLAKAEYDIKSAEAKARTENAKKQAAKILTKDKAATIADLLKPHNPDGEEPTPRRYITTNATYEALAELIQQNPNGLLVDRDEMLALLDWLDEEGHADERGFYLSGWNGDTPYTVDRIGRGLDLHCDAVCISMIGGTQPARISQYMAHVRRGRRGNDGLIQRFGLIVWPDIPMTWSNIDRKPNREGRDSAFQAFRMLDTLDWRVIGGRRDRGMGGDEEGLPFVRLCQEAHDRFVVWRTELEHRLRKGEMDPMMESHLAKYRKLIPGLALTIHLTDGGTGEVGDAAVEKAIKWAAYLETHAARTYASTTIASSDAARAIIAKIRSGHLKEQFGSREIVRAQWSMLRDSETIHAALQLLVDHEWLDAAKVETGGRKATVYTVNPKAVQRENAQQ